MTVRDIEGYELGAALGEGTAGGVFRARKLDTGETVALKLLHPEHAEDEHLQKRFVREVSVLQKLDHPNVVRFHDCGLHDGAIYFTMELVEFGTLKSVLARRGRLSWREVCECGIQLADALGHLHEHGIVHRDLKPGNVFLSEEGLLKLGDFGLARDTAAVGLTLPGYTVGSCRYMAPEQIRGESGVTGTADLYALGCVLFEMLTGRVPFDGTMVVEIFDGHLEGAVPGVRDHVPDCPERLERLVQRLLAKDTADRPDSASAVKAELEALLASPEAGSRSRSEPASTRTEPRKPAIERNLVERLVSETAPERPFVAIPLIVAGALLIVGLLALAALMGA